MSRTAIASPWELVEAWQDPFVGEVVPAARVVNDDGYSFAIFRSADGRVRAYYALPPSTFDRLPAEGRVLMIRPGTMDSVEIEAEIVPGRFVEKGRTDGLSVRDLIWHGQEPAPTRGTLRNLLDSDRLHARFFLDDGRTVDTDWMLDGAPPVIAQALTIETEVDQAERDWAKILAATLIGRVQSCSANGLNRACINTLDACGAILDKDRDTVGFEACMAARGF
ncbi:hypothetical protein [Defluviimonas salinarum]|uniref:Uncharacterized protein n=1 Tax=Defluviimonas salinarum TaxID=2992147 RepID=A0ABT3J6B4_9RHOB|nr:hypothetical protein [Defluviimonas salinarum]MCW3783227.1 hypothetical protein [Defluviimonas salinarum]